MIINFNCSISTNTILLKKRYAIFNGGRFTLIPKSLDNVQNKIKTTQDEANDD